VSRNIWSVAAEGGVRVAYGVLDMLQLGLVTQFAVSPSVTFPMVNSGGQPGNLTADLYAIEFALDARFIFDVSISRAFSRFHPLFGVRSGGLVRILTSQALVDDHQLLIMRVGNDTTVLPAITTYVGAEYRFARSWLVGLVFNFTYASNRYYAIGSNLELSWASYSRF
jgi:hypothetical protein